MGTNKFFRLWAIAGPLAGYIYGSLGSESKVMDAIVAQLEVAAATATAAVGTNGETLRRSTEMIPDVVNTASAGASGACEKEKELDLLPHLEDCDKPQSPRSLQEMAADYKPTKFRYYLHTNYDRFYPQWMEKYRKKKFRMLEIGLDTGRGSLLWQEYFPCATLVGLEYNRDNTQNEGASKIQAVVGDQGDANFLEGEFMKKTDGGNFDLIVDDGGHHYEQQRTSYEVLFQKALNPGGLYIMEDIETSYWAQGTLLYGSRVTRGGQADPHTIINEFKQVVDVVNKKFHDDTYTVMGQVDQLISTLAFGQNVIFMEKKTKDHCWNERPYIWPERLAGPAKSQPLNSNQDSILGRFCQEQGIKIAVRDKYGKWHAN